MLALLLACSPQVQLTGRLEPAWWFLDAFGEQPTDRVNYSYVVRLDAPHAGAASVMYLPRGYGNLLPDRAAVACVGGRVVVEGRFDIVGWPSAEGALTGARVVRCEAAPTMEPAFGETVTLTGVFRRWWWYRAPGFGDDPVTDDRGYGYALLVGDRVVPVFSRKDAASRGEIRRFGAACDGQSVTLTGRWEAGRYARMPPPYKLLDATFEAPCAAPALDGPAEVGDKPMPADWLLQR